MPEIDSTVEQSSAIEDPIVPSLSEESDNEHCMNSSIALPSYRSQKPKKTSLSNNRTFKLRSSAKFKKGPIRAVTPRQIVMDDYECQNKSCSWWNGFSPPGELIYGHKISDISIYKCTVCEDTYLCELCLENDTHQEHDSSLIPFHE